MSFLIWEKHHCIVGRSVGRLVGRAFKRCNIKKYLLNLTIGYFKTNICWVTKQCNWQIARRHTKLLRFPIIWLNKMCMANVRMHVGHVFYHNNPWVGLGWVRGLNKKKNSPFGKIHVSCSKRCLDHFPVKIAKADEMQMSCTPVNLSHLQQQSMKHSAIRSASVSKYEREWRGKIKENNRGFQTNSNFPSRKSDKRFCSSESWECGLNLGRFCYACLSTSNVTIHMLLFFFK